MAKTYDIVSIIGDNQFTYQLYNNLSPSVEGTSAVATTLTASNDEILVVSFNKSGAQDNWTINWDNSATYPLTSLVLTRGIGEFGTGIYFSVASYESEESPAVVLSSGFYAQGTQVQGIYSIYKNGTDYKIYLENTVLITATFVEVCPVVNSQTTLGITDVTFGPSCP